MSGRQIYTRALGKAVAKKAKPSHAKKLHVLSNDDNNWVVVVEGKARPVKKFTTQHRAIIFAKTFAVSRSGGEILVHDSDGQISRSMTVR